ncbi:MAG TPA: hypothetical protein VFC67_07970 [Prolixibacteraceae bacterium]|nr:hypothetical protein [Prolixibacteraceae bacterium]
MTTYYIKPSAAEEALESWIWTNDTNVSGKGFIVVKNPKNGKKIKTFKRTLDGDFVRLYNDKHNTSNIVSENSVMYLVINEYYREILGIQKNTSIELDLSKANLCQKLFLIHWNHPNPSVQFANRATFISIIIGAIALLLTLYSIYMTFKPNISVFCPCG